MITNEMYDAQDGNSGVAFKTNVKWYFSFYEEANELA